MACPLPEDWVSLAEGGDPQRREDLLSHAGACPGCLKEFAAALAGQEAREGSLPPLPEALRGALLRAIPPARRRTWPWTAAAAAGLLLAAGLVSGLLGEGQTPVPTSPPTQAPPSANPFATATLGLGCSGTLVLREGSRADLSRVAQGHVALHAGGLLATARGSAVEVSLGSCRIRMEEGELLLESEKPSGLAGFLLLLGGEACAAEGPAGLLSVLSGHATVIHGADERTVSSGQGLEITPEALRRAAPAPLPPWAGAWTDARSVGTLRDASAALAPPALPADHAWELVLKRRSAEASVELRFAAGGMGWALPLGGNLVGPAGEPVRIGLEARGGWVRLEVRGQEILCCPATSLRSRVQPAEVRAHGLKAWGGDVEILEARWRALP